MNFLAHLHLAPPDGARAVGNLAADLVKGRAILQLPAAVQAGILQHRAVDRFTDEHPAVRASRARFPARWSRLSGVLVDLVFDHYLATDWETFEAEPLRPYLDRRYPTLLAEGHTLPEPMQRWLERLVEQDRLYSYREFEGIRLALVRVERLLSKRHPPLPEAIETLAELEPDLRRDFHDFYPHLRRHIANA